MNTNVFDEFLDKNVEVSTSNKTFSGNLKRNADHGTLVITPVDKYSAKRYGAAIVDQNSVTSIRAILPRESLKYDSDGDDMCEDKQMVSEESIG